MKIKPTLLAAALLASIASTSQAQQAPAAEPSTEVNPFTGRSLSAEQTQRELELARLNSQILEERLKQLNLLQELGNVPLRKSVEAAQARTAVKKEEINIAELTEAFRSASAARERQERLERQEEAERTRQLQAQREVERRQRAEAQAAANREKTQAREAVKENVQTPPPVSITLLSVMNLGASRTATFDVNGQTLVVRDGEMTPFGLMSFAGHDSVHLGDTTFKVHRSTIARFVVSDPKPVTPNQGGLPQGTPIAPVAVSSASQPSTPGPNVTPPAAGQRAQLPPLQLPPGVNVLPPSATPPR